MGKDSQGPHRGPRSRFHVAQPHGAQTDFHLKGNGKFQQQRVAMDIDWSRWRMKQLSLCGMMIDATILLVSRTLLQFKTPQLAHDSSARVTSNILHAPHISASKCPYPQHTDHQWKSCHWYEDEDSAGVNASSRHKSRSTIAERSWSATSRTKKYQKRMHEPGSTLSDMEEFGRIALERKKYVATPEERLLPQRPIQSRTNPVKEEAAA